MTNETDRRADADAMRLALMEMTESIRPMREFLAGEVAYFLGQGFTEEQAHALAAAEFTSVFGLRIAIGASLPEDGQ